MNNSYEGILCLLFKDKITGYSFTVYCCYLPPENSPYGRDSTSFFTHLLCLIYLHNYTDSSFIFGDINARLGNKQDLIHDIDDEMSRTVIDATSNTHGDAFLDFLMESRMLVANGRVPGCNEFTSISSKGRSVVDWFAVPHDIIGNCTSCDVLSVSSLIETYGLASLVSERCKPPDHSIVTLTFKMINSVTDGAPDINEHSSTSTDRRYNYGTMTSEFMNSSNWTNILDTLILRLEHIDKSQDCIDRYYQDMLSKIFHEMDENIQYKDASKRTKKHYKNHKPFWNDELTAAWKNMSNSEKLYLKDKSKNYHLREQFILKRKMFDKLLRKTERSYYRKKALDIEELNTSNPTEFWQHIKSLGPKSKPKIPMEVYTSGISGTKCFDQDIVLSRWKNDFKELYNRPDDEDQNSEDVFYENILSTVSDIKSFELSNAEVDIVEYNRPFTPEELDKIRCKMKNNKAVGPDMIPNEILKHEGIKTLLLSFVNTCFVNNVIPSIWRSSIIAPIPKSASKDPCVPLNYRGISLLSCLYKLYTSMLNLRLTNYCENNNYLVDEQNGFRPKRSCQDHIYVLSSIIRNRKVQKKDTFCAFVDFKKSF